MMIVIDVDDGGGGIDVSVVVVQQLEDGADLSLP